MEIRIKGFYEMSNYKILEILIRRYKYLSVKSFGEFMAQ